MGERRPRVSAISASVLESKILEGRGVPVMIDEHLAELYGVTVSALIQAMKRNKERFPDDFVFQLSAEEWNSLRSQNVIANREGRGGRRTPPYAFTEHGILMLSSVLRSPRAVAVNIEIMRTFVRLRHLLATHEQLGRKLASMERRYDERFRVVFDTLRKLTETPTKPRRRIGFE
jgi:hypothetical protein